MPERRTPPPRRRASRAAPARAAAAPLSVVILAAGEGKRMRSALPKGLQRLAGRPLLKHVIDTARSLVPATLQVVYGHGGEAVRAALAGESVAWTLQAERLGTGHAVAQALPGIPGDNLVLVLYGDVPLIGRATLAALLAAAGPRRLALLTARLDNPEGYGRIVRNGRGLVQKIVEEADATPRQRTIRECNTGVLAAPAHLLRGWLARLTTDNARGEYYLTDVIALAVRDRVEVRPLLTATAAEALGVNDKAQLAQLEALCRTRAAHELLAAGVTLADPGRLDVRGTLVVGSDVFIDVNVVFEGRVVLGDGARTEVFPHCVIDHAVIGPECNIGPFARFRPSSTLAAGVHIGNFVEVKNSRLGAGSKANHLSYVGDAELGRGVNIGAGTIIANYDGAVKHRTVIGDDVHTGSNSVLVAPITVGAGATIAAGSTVTREVPAGKRTVARARQATVDGWQRPVKPRK